MENGVGPLKSHCTFIWGENQKKKFLTSSPVEVLILFNEEHQVLLKLQVWSRNGGGWSEVERVGMSPREGTMEQALVGRLLWLSGTSW